MAVKESTLEKLRRIMRDEGTESLDQTITSLIVKAGKVPKTMFGVDRESKILLTKREHEEFSGSQSS